MFLRWTRRKRERVEREVTKERVSLYIMELIRLPPTGSMYIALLLQPRSLRCHIHWYPRPFLLRMRWEMTCLRVWLKIRHYKQFLMFAEHHYFYGDTMKRSFQNKQSPGSGLRAVLRRVLLVLSQCYLK